MGKRINRWWAVPAFALAAGYRGMTLPEPSPEHGEPDSLS